MTVLDAFIKRVFEIHKGSLKYIDGLQGINTIVSRLGRTITHFYKANIDNLSAIIKALTMLNRQMSSLLITRWVNDLVPQLRAIFDSGITEIGEAGISRLEPLRISIIRRLLPPTDIITSLIGSILKESSKVSIPVYRGITTIPPTPFVSHPPTLGLMSTVSEYVSRISEVGQSAYETAPAVTIRVSLDYGDEQARVTRGISKAVMRGVREAYSVEALEAKPFRLEAVDTIREIPSRLIAPAHILAPPIERAQRYFPDVSEAGRVPRPITRDVSEAYSVKVLEPVSKFHEVSRFVGRVPVPPHVRARPAIEIAKEGRLGFTIREMERGLPFITEGAVKAYMEELPGIMLQIAEVVGEIVSEVHVKRAVSITQPITKRVKEAYSVSVLESISKVREVSKSIGRVPPQPIPALDIIKAGGLLSTIPDLGRGLHLISEGEAIAYRIELPLMGPPPTEVVEKRVAEAPLREVFAIIQPMTKDVSKVYDSRVLKPMSKVYDFSSFTGRFPFPSKQALEIEKTGRLALRILERVRGLHLITEGAAEAYSMALPVFVPPPTEVEEERVLETPLRVVVKYAPQIRVIDKLDYDLVRHVALIPTIKPPHIETRLVEEFLKVKSKDIDIASQKVAEVYRGSALVAWTPPILEVSKVASDHIQRISDMVLKSTREYMPGVSEVLLVTEATKVAPSISTISKFTGRIPSFSAPVVEKDVVSRHVSKVPEIERIYRPIAEKAAETYRLGLLSLVPSPIEAVAERGVEGGVKEFPLTVPMVMQLLPSVEMAKMISGYIGPMPEIIQALDMSGAVSRDVIAQASGFGVIEPYWLYTAPEVMEAVGSISRAFSKVSGKLPGIVKEKYLEVARTSPVYEYFVRGTMPSVVSELISGLDMTRGVMKGFDIEVPGVVPSPSSIEMAKMVKGVIGTVSEVSRSLDISQVVSKGVIDYKMGVEAAIKSSIGGVVTNQLRGLGGRYALERIQLGTPMSVPTVKLHEIIPLLSSVRTPNMTEKPTTVKRDRLVDRTRPIEVKVDSVKGEIDMRELKRKIARILREEARRHGVY